MTLTKAGLLYTPVFRVSIQSNAGETQMPLLVISAIKVQWANAARPRDLSTTRQDHTWHMKEAIMETPNGTLGSVVGPVTELGHMHGRQAPLSTDLLPSPISLCLAVVFVPEHWYLPAGPH